MVSGLLYIYIPLLIVPRKIGKRDLTRLSTEPSGGREIRWLLTKHVKYSIFSANKRHLSHSLLSVLNWNSM